MGYDNIDNLLFNPVDYLENSAEKRQSFLHELAQAKATIGNNKVSKQLKIMQRNEAQRASAARIRRINGTTRSSKGIPKVVVPNEMGGEIEINDKTLMEKALLTAYEATLTQSNSTPCTTSPLKECLGSYVTGPLVDDILAGIITSFELLDCPS